MTGTPTAGSQLGPFTCSEWTVPDIPSNAPADDIRGRIALSTYPGASVKAACVVWAIGVVALWIIPLPEPGYQMALHVAAGVVFFGLVGASFLGRRDEIAIALGPCLASGGRHGTLRIESIPLVPFESSRIYNLHLPSVTSLRVAAVDVPDVHYGQRGGFRVEAILEGGIVVPLMHEYAAVPVEPFNELVDVLAPALNLDGELKRVHHGADAPPENTKALRAELHVWRRPPTTDLLASIGAGPHVRL